MTPKALRVNAGYTQQYVSEYLGLSLTSYKRRENNHVKWFADELKMLSDLYEIKINYFFEGKVSRKDTCVQEVS
ncbi:helix-turn-helix transcriptional regulator [Bacillus thuringiensis]|nr:helix-turn-helix transcriptional regulator [Bacillus thuringiensis]